MQRLSVILATVAIVLLGNIAVAHQEVDEIAVGGRIKKPGPYNRIEDESLAALINRIGGIPVSQSDLERYQRGEQVLHLQIHLYRNGKKRVLKIDPRSNELWALTLMKNDAVEVARAEPFEGAKYPATLILKKEFVEQAGAGQPATAPESKSEGKDNPQPVSKPASR